MTSRLLLPLVRFLQTGSLMTRDGKIVARCDGVSVDETDAPVVVNLSHPSP